eukprot:CAMPEP_0179983894 /NCGR_PEP_ID=MMETSP0984-20121128/824_1 /TAXON_ID=483367 /ORGANISM="non described non described, Strain CCMP 2436" /LENGTH=148 /DNA_ID=CAMNT_0021902407 /DNA_START=600 /DNA_END=1046 /DNA_ORIENTATION=+
MLAHARPEELMPQQQAGREAQRLERHEDHMSCEQWADRAPLPGLPGCATRRADGEEQVRKQYRAGEADGHEQEHLYLVGAVARERPRIVTLTVRTVAKLEAGVSEVGHVQRADCGVQQPEGHEVVVGDGPEPARPLERRHVSGPPARR